MYEIYFGTYDKKEKLVYFLRELRNRIDQWLGELEEVEDRPSERRFFYTRMMFNGPVNVYADDESAEFVIGGPPEEDK
jgi:hypothetical protein